MSDEAIVAPITIKHLITGTACIIALGVTAVWGIKQFQTPHHLKVDGAGCRTIIASVWQEGRSDTSAVKTNLAEALFSSTESSNESHSSGGMSDEDRRYAQTCQDICLIYGRTDEGARKDQLFDQLKVCLSNEIDRASRLSTQSAERPELPVKPDAPHTTPVPAGEPAPTGEPVPQPGRLAPPKPAPSSSPQASPQPSARESPSIAKACAPKAVSPFSHQTPDGDKACTRNRPGETSREWSTQLDGTYINCKCG